MYTLKNDFHQTETNQLTARRFTIQLTDSKGRTDSLLVCAHRPDWPMAHCEHECHSATDSAGKITHAWYLPADGVRREITEFSDWISETGIVGAIDRAIGYGHGLAMQDA